VAITEDARVWSEHQQRFISPHELGCTSIGSSPVISIETQGPSLRVRPDDVVHTDRGEVPASKLRRGDHVAYLQCPPVAVNRDAQKVRLGEIVGYITGDGTMHGERAMVGAGTPNAVPPRVKETLRAIAPPRQEWFGSDTEYDPHRLFALLAGVGIDDNVKFAIPAWVQEGSLEVILGFVRGVFAACGRTSRTVVVSGREPRFDFRSEELEEPGEDYEEGEVADLSISLPTLYDSKRSVGRMNADLQLLLLRLGVVSRRQPGAGLVIAPESLGAFEAAIGSLDPVKASAIAALPRATFERDGYLRVERITRPRKAVDVFGLPDASRRYVNGVLMRASL
jgi:hypothetical protein